MHHNIVLIDDNFAIRQIIKIFLTRLSKKYSFDLNIYTSDNGVEGLGYVFITNPNIIIVDTTLPKYSGRDIIEFFVRNTKFRSDDIQVIVLEENPRKKLNLPSNFHSINKNKHNSFDELTDILIQKLNISDFGRMSRFYDSLGGFVMKYSNKDDILSKKISKKIRLKNFFYSTKWAILEILISCALGLIMLVFGKPKDDNITQSRLDRNTFRTKYYPTLALSFVSALFILINVTLFTFSQISIFRNNLLETRALTTFVVDSTADSVDFSIGDGFCDTDDSVGDGPCTYRAAIQEANVTVDDVTISFNIPGAGVHTLIPGSIYPTITRSIVIDGTTEAGTDCSTSTLMIEFNGTSIGGGAAAIQVGSASNSNIVIKGLVIQNFNGAGITLTDGGVGTATITCNIIGLDGDGVTITDNINGIMIGDNVIATIGGTSPEDRNIISGNTGDGIQVFNDGIATILGNYVGTDKSGLLDKGNGTGVRLINNSTLGGSTTNHRNIISGNETGVVTSINSTVQNNYIGIGTDGLTNVGNDVGISIGNDSIISDNIISFNGSGITIHGSYTDNLGTIEIENNIIGLDIDDNSAGNNTGIGITAGDMWEGFWGSGDVHINNNTISSNTWGVTSTWASFEGGTIYINMDNNRIGVTTNNLEDRGNEYSGIYAQGGGTFTNNIIAYNGHVQEGSAALESSTTSSDITGNQFISNDAGGMALGSSSGITIGNNSFTGNLYSMQLSGLENSEIGSNTFCSSNGGEFTLSYSNNNIISNNKFGSTNDTSLEITGTSTGNSITHNAFAQSIEIPIDLGDNGQTANDSGDSDTGVNNLQNYPSDISLVGDDITFNLDTNAGNYRVEFHIPDNDSCSSISSIVCSGDITHPGGNQSHTLNCPGLPIGDFDIYALSALIIAPDEYGDTSELSPIVTLNNPSPTNTPTPSLTPSTTQTPVPTSTNTPVPIPTHTLVPTLINSPVPTDTPLISEIPETTSAFVEPTSEQSFVNPSPTEEAISATPPHTVRPTSQIPVEVIENLSLDLSPNDTYAIPEDSILNSPEVKSTTLSLTQGLNNIVEESQVIGSLLRGSINIGERIKPLTDNLSYLLSLQFIGLQTAQLGVTSLNILALATPAIVSAFSQPKILYYALAWFWKRKSKQPWGVVFDKDTAAPIAFATLVLTLDGKTVSTQTTDLQGKYGFFVNKGKYQIYFTHADYLDFVSDIEVNYDGEIISKDFEATPKSREDVNSNIRWTFYKLKKQIANNLFILNTIVFSIGFVYTLFAITNHLTIINYLILTLYLFQFVLMFVFYFFKDKEFGQVIDVSTGLPVSGAIVRVFNEERQIDVTITDSQGRYSFILEPGNYFLKASANGYVFPSDNTPNITKDKLGGKLLKFTTQDKQRVNIKIYMRKFASLNTNRKIILSPFN